MRDGNQTGPPRKRLPDDQAGTTTDTGLPYFQLRDWHRDSQPSPRDAAIRMAGRPHTFANSWSVKFQLPVNQDRLSLLIQMPLNRCDLYLLLRIACCTTQWGNSGGLSTGVTGFAIDQFLSREKYFFIFPPESVPLGTRRAT